MSRVAEVQEVSRSQLHVRVFGISKPRGAYSKAADAELLPAIRRLVDQRPTSGYRRIAALLDRERRIAGPEPVNRKRVLRILGQHGLTLERSTGRREGRVHDGKVAVMASNLRSPVGSNQWRLTGSLLGCLGDHLLERRARSHRARPLFLNQWRTWSLSSTPLTARSSPTSPWQAPASPARTSAT